MSRKIRSSVSLSGGRSRRGRWSVTRPAPAIAIAIVVVLLISDLPISLGTVTGEHALPTNPSNPAKSSAVAPPSPSIAPVGSSSLTSKADRSSPDAQLCQLGAIQRCGKAARPAELPVTPAASQSSWTDITPPSGQPNPSARLEPAESYYPAGHDVILFGGFGVEANGTSIGYLGDTWSFVDNRWTEVISNASCTPTTCPSPRSGAMMTYDPARAGLLLFGGENNSFAFNDTWLFANGSWTNITSSAGAAPCPRYLGAMTYDPSDGYIVLYGGSNVLADSMSDTWEFGSGHWTNITTTVGTSPGPRSGAAIAASPSGYVLLYGGEITTDIGADSSIWENSCEGTGGVAYWFHDGKWSALTYPFTGLGDCAPKRPAESGVPPSIEPANSTPAAATAIANPPCGRVGASLGWSPKNSRFVLYGGYGPTSQAQLSDCTGGPGELNDTYTYGDTPGGTFAWFSASDSGDPSPRAYMGYASDFTDDYFEIFGGADSVVVLDQTWRFYEIVHARLTGPSGINTAAKIHLTLPFVVTGYGGSGNLTYHLAAKGLVNGNNLDSGSGCAPFYNPASPYLPYTGQVNFTCVPAPRSFNVYRITLLVADHNNTTDFATANWTFSVLPPEEMDIFSEFSPYFYSGITLENTFSIYTEVNNGPATSISATLGGGSLAFSQRPGHPDWWDASVDMASVPVGAILSATAHFGNWTQNTTYSVSMITFPAWLATVFDYATHNQTITTSGAGADNRTYNVTDSYAWNLGNGMGFSLPIDLLAGSYDMVPSLQVVFSATSGGDLAIVGHLPLSAPSIDIGPASLSLNITLSLAGRFDVVGSGVQWENASARIGIDADLSMSVPIYGFSILGVTIGFTLQVGINASAALKLILAPTTDTKQEIISGIGVMIQNFIGSFSVALSAAVDFGIGIASVGIGGSVSVAMTFVTQPDFAIHDGWVNGTLFVTASFLFWSDQWDLASGTIYEWDPPGPGVHGEGAPADGGYNTTGGPWTLENRYYNVTGYDAPVWDPADSEGPAISDIYPLTEVTGTGAYNGPYLFYTVDNVSESPREGLGFTGDHLNTTTNALSAIRSPPDPGYLAVSPQATTLADGDLFVLWDALPLAEAKLASPLDLKSLLLQGATFDPATGVWGPIRTFSVTGIAESFRASPQDGGDVAALISTTPLLGDSSPEYLVEYNLTTGAVVYNDTTSGVSEILSIRGAAELAVLQLLDGNYSLFDLATGKPVPIDYAPPSGDDLISAGFVVRSDTDLVLLYRGGNSSELVLYDTATDKVLASTALGGSASEAEGIGGGATTYLFARTSAGISAWSVVDGKFTVLASDPLLGIQSYGVAGAASSILVFAEVSNGNRTEPIKTLTFDLVDATLAPIRSPSGGPPSPSPSTSTSTDYLLYLGIAAGAVVLLLAVVYVGTRKGPPRSPRPEPTPPATEDASFASSPGTAPPSPPTV